RLARVRRRGKRGRGAGRGWRDARTGPRGRRDRLRWDRRGARGWLRGGGDANEGGRSGDLTAYGRSRREGATGGEEDGRPDRLVARGLGARGQADRDRQALARPRIRVLYK